MFLSEAKETRKRKRERKRNEKGIMQSICMKCNGKEREENGELDKDKNGACRQ